MFHPKIEGILENQLRRVAQARTKPLPNLKLERRDFLKALRRKPFSLITEIKPASLSEGKLRSNREASLLAVEMERAGANALSVLTEATEFSGSTENLTKAKQACSLPVLAKDFVVDEFQIQEAAAYGADAILLIVEIVGKKLGELVQVAKEHELTCVVECLTKEEIEEAAAAGAQIIGVNNRNFRDLSVDLNRTKRLAHYVPEDCLFASESGIFSRKDIETLLPYGVDTFLVGTSLMKSKNVGEKVRELLRGKT